jgi:hypothetical protein
MPHKHAELMALYAEDAAETDKPWERWEYNNPEDKHGWLPCFGDLRFFVEFEFRRKAPKPERVKVNFYINPTGDVLIHLAGSVSDHQRESLSRYTRITPDFGGDE